MAAKLVAEEGALKGLVLPLEDGDQWVIGRDPDACQLLIEDPVASRRHLICRSTPNGIVLENLSTTNPVLVNHEQVDKPRLLDNGDLVKIGSGLFRFYSESEARLFNESPEVDEAPEKEEKQEEKSPPPPEPENDGEPKEQEPASKKSSTARSTFSTKFNSPYESKSSVEFQKPDSKNQEEPSTEKSEPPHEEETATEEKKPEPSREDELFEKNPPHEEEEPPEEVEAVEEAAPQETEHPEEVEAAEEAAPQETEHPEEVEAAEEAAPQETEHPEEPEPITESIPSEEAEPSHEEIFSDEDLEEEEGLLEEVEEDTFGGRRDTIFDEEAEEGQDLLANIDFEITETGRWLLKVVGGPNTGAEFVMQAGRSYIVGTDPGTCDVIFNDTSVSRQHVRLAISDDDTITIEDLRSRNGTLVDGERLEGKMELDTNVVVNLGTTAFVVFDREGEMKTIISPLLPSIVKVLQKEEEPPAAEQTPASQETEPSPEQAEELTTPISREEIKEKTSTTLTAFILIAIITGTFILMGIGFITLFRTEPVEIHQVSDIQQRLAEALAPFPGVEKSYNRSTGTLMVVGHVLNDNDWRQLQYNLRDLNFVNELDIKGVVIDQKVAQELNPVLAKNPAWRGVTLQPTAPGQFVLTGYLKNRRQMESLVEYMTANFLYLDRLQYRVVVEEDVAAKVKLDLTEAGLPNINVTVNNGDLVLKGVIPSRMSETFAKLMVQFKQIPGIRNVQDLVSEVKEDRSTIDITDRYLVTGISRTGNNVSVVIDGRIVSKGDSLDGMTITEITPQAMFLQKDGVNYRIDLR